MAQIQQTFVIRPFADSDHEPAAALWNQLNPDWPTTAQEERESDAVAEERFRCTRFVAEVGDEWAGMIGFGTNPGAYHPRKFSFTLNVHPIFHGQGIGKGLYAKMLQTLEPTNPISLGVSVRENQPRALHFFTERGFVETKRDWISVLEVSKANLEAYAHLDIAPLRIASFAQLQQAHPDASAKLHELFSDIRIDTPRTEPATPIALNFFEANILGSSDYRPEAFFVALDGAHWVGLSGLFHIGDSDALDHWFTGVRRSHRGRGVAQALKVATVRYAQQNGLATIRTDNDSLNAPMLAINEKLGFVRGAALISMRKLLREEP